MRTVVLVLSAVAIVSTTVPTQARDGAGDWSAPGRMVMEYVGQVVNGSPASTSSRQFGNLRAVAGVDDSQPLTFYTEAVTTSTVANGPLRIVDREGTTTIYLASAPGSFDNPDSFRSGTPVQVSTLRQQVIVDTSTGLFTVVNVNTITSATEFPAARGQVTLGGKGQSFRTTLTGHLNAPGALPSGWFGGFAIS